MRSLITISLIALCSLAFSEDLPAPPDPTAPATAVQVPGHWEQQPDHTAVWRPASWQIRQGSTVAAAPAPAPVTTVVVAQQQPQVIYVQQQPQEPQRVVYATPAPRQVLIYPERDGIYEHVGYGVSNGYYGDSPLLPTITYDWQVYGNQQLRGGCHRGR